MCSMMLSNTHGNQSLGRSGAHRGSLKVSGERTKAAVNEGVQEFIARRRQKGCWSSPASSSGRRLRLQEGAFAR